MSRTEVQLTTARYVVFDEIAAGGMATVHLGRLLGTGGFSRTVAIKRLHPHLAKDPTFAAMLLDEARIAARIRHPNVVATLDVVDQAGELFLVMEHINGVVLSELRRRGRPIPLRIAASIMCGILHGLHAAHEAVGEDGTPLGVIHRDVSPQNVIVGADGISRLLDFGIAKAVGRSQATQDGAIKGKLAYMAPEQLRGDALTRQCDIFAAAIVLWELLTGEKLFQADSQAATIGRVLEEPIRPPRAIVPNLPEAIDEIALRGLSRSRAQRYSTAKEMANAIEAAIRPASGSEVAAWIERAAPRSLAARERQLRVVERERAPRTDVPTKDTVIWAETPEQRTLSDAFVRRWLGRGRATRAILVSGVALGAIAAPLGLLLLRSRVPARDAKVVAEIASPAPAVLEVHAVESASTIPDTTSAPAIIPVAPAIPRGPNVIPRRAQPPSAPARSRTPATCFEVGADGQTRLRSECMK